MRQLITPDPDIPCQPGWCLAYVNEAFGVPKRYGTATAAWQASSTKHTGRDVPAGVWTPVWYALANEPAGHVALHAPDGSVYSTSDLTTIPHHHPDLNDLERSYAYYGMPLTWRGWTEDVEDTPVLAPDDIAAMGTTTTQEDNMPLTDADIDKIFRTPMPNGAMLVEVVESFRPVMDNVITTTAGLVLNGTRQLSAKDIADALSPQLAADLLTELLNRK